MIRRWFPAGSLFLIDLGLVDDGPDSFLIGQWSGGFSLLEDSVREGASFVQQGNGSVEGHTHGDRGLSQGIAGAWCLYLILAVLELAGQVLRQGAGMLWTQDQGEFGWGVQDRSVGIVGALGGYGKALVVRFDKGGQEGIGSVPVTDAL